MAQLDERSRNDDFPTWENAYYACGAMRVSGFSWARGEALVFESLVYSARTNAVQCVVHAYGALPRVGDLGAAATLLDWDDLREELSADSWRSRVSGLVFHQDDDGRLRIERPRGGVARAFTMKLGGKKLELPVAVPKGRGASLKRFTPEEAVLFQLCDRASRDRLFSPVPRLRKLARVPAKAKLAFVRDDWQHPAAGKPASRSPDLKEMAAALTDKRPLAKLRGKPNGNFRFWLRRMLKTRSQENEAEWG